MALAVGDLPGNVRGTTASYGLGLTLRSSVVSGDHENPEWAVDAALAGDFLAAVARLRRLLPERLS